MATIIKRKGKYFVQVRRKGFPTACRTFHIKTDAEQWARHMDIKADRGDLPSPVKILDSIKVRDILIRYQDEVTIKKRGAYFERYVINAFLNLPIANLTIARVTTAHFSTYREMRLKEVNPATINRQLGVIKHAFDVAIREWGVPLKENPLTKLKKLKVNNARTRRLEVHEWEAIKAAVLTSRNLLMMPMIKLAIETALRRSELLSLQWQHIDFEARTAFIPVTKNGYSRAIPLTSEAINVLEEIKSFKGCKKTVFSNMTGNAVHQAWERIMQRANIQNLHFHDLRHEAIIFAQTLWSIM